MLRRMLRQWTRATHTLAPFPRCVVADRGSGHVSWNCLMPGCEALLSKATLVPDAETAVKAAEVEAKRAKARGGGGRGRD